jgi:hypothetical protein
MNAGKRSTVVNVELDEDVVAALKSWNEAEVEAKAANVVLVAAKADAQRKTDAAWKACCALAAARSCAAKK